MIKAWASWLGALALAVALLPATGHAATGGLANLHDQARYGNRVCFTDHTHSGSGSALSKAAAAADATRAWSDFVVFEYGSEWGSFRAAVNQNISCSATGSGYSCVASANACRPSGAAVAVLRPAKHVVVKVKAYKKLKKKIKKHKKH